MFSLSVHRDSTVVCALKMYFNTFPFWIFWIFEKICDGIIKLEEFHKNLNTDVENYFWFIRIFLWQSWNWKPVTLKLYWQRKKDKSNQIKQFLMSVFLLISSCKLLHTFKFSSNQLTLGASSKRILTWINVF